MVNRRGKQEAGVSDLIGTILIILLVIGLAAVVAAFLMPGLLQKSVYIASKVTTVEVGQSGGTSIEVLSVLPESGEPFQIIGQKNAAGGARVSVKALSPDGRIMSPDGSSLSGNLYGKQLYIYPSEKPGAHPCELNISETLPPYNLREMVHGKWTIQFVDEDAHILVMSNSDGVITRGTTSLPTTSGSLGDLMFRADCSLLPNTSFGTSPNRLPLFNSTMNMFYRSFDGTTQYYQYPNDPSLTFNGNNMAISLWFNPNNVVPYSGPNGVGWHQLIGKGVTNGAGSGSSAENDNYQVFQLGDRLLFEWNDAGTGNHYQAITPPAVHANQWNYLTVNVQNGQLSIYNNGGAPLPLIYVNSNVPDINSVLGPVPVNLQNNNNDLRVGAQNGQGSYYYSGYMGNMALYNRPLTANEIQQNLQTFSA